MSEVNVYPTAEAAEMAFIGSMWIEPRQVRKYMRRVTDEWFTHNDYKIAWGAMCAIVNAGGIPDNIALDSYLERHRLDPDGEVLMSVQMAGGESTFNSFFADTYAKQMQDAWKQRRLLVEASRLASCGQRGDFKEALKTLNKLVKDLAGNGNIAFEMDGLTAAKTMLDSVELYMNDPESSIMTGISALDRVIGPMSPGMLITVGAASSVGKSTFGLSLALRIASRFEKVFNRVYEEGQSPTLQCVEYLTFEMTAVQQIMRGATNLIEGLALEDLVMGFREKEDEEPDWARFYLIRAALEERMETLGRHIHFHQVARSVDEIRSLVQTAVLERGSRIFFVDQSEYVRSDERDMVKRYTEIYQAYKDIAIEYGVVIVALHQLSRKVTERSTKLPELEDLRESGGVGNASDLVLLLYRPAYYWLDEGNPEEGMYADPSWYREGMMIFIEKRRMGKARRSSARAYVRFDESRCMIDNRPDEWDENAFVHYYSVKNGSIKEAA